MDRKKIIDLKTNLQKLIDENEHLNYENEQIRILLFRYITNNWDKPLKKTEIKRALNDMIITSKDNRPELI